MNHETSSYGLWSLVFINSAIFIFFAFSFTRPSTKRDWRSLGAFSAFILALFIEMYGFPLTIYFLSGWLGSRFPQLNLFSHDAGHLWYSLLGFKGNPHWNPIHLLSTLFILLGFFLLSASWRVLYVAQKEHRLAKTGPYSYVRHPQYIAFILVMLGFLIQWPTLLTIFMFPLLTIMYVRLAKREEQETSKQFGEEYQEYCSQVPAFIPHYASFFSKERKTL